MYHTVTWSKRFLTFFFNFHLNVYYIYALKTSLFRWLSV